ncbi:hypothetical protein COS31_02425 [Candidatus Roizmanbacteria bacterium CG02_land_8_20_14_3_00_36_15]|uniref:Metallo-beta-lactamase domain-containing protein n=2 Tax=Candidatus Roizmaniibacteriota TaxID=1752723 RepID=A0A2M8KLQ7_9BACT|nr:MAG: hypothetical protein COS51_02930 [Candidatus Roizmanbacteria bacterium CG03_land_8_20_14_0_80_36_21]PIV37922.1 MAG: hypothetical protein COS31_02425 [Candidatus Roizmanbacteria bacterium CG02_land_8_20_14_3_00_36_15]PIY69892.1 MAG: hypothetical protein COY89_04135 [Candidatus Roizmanbacteria bacterium CG_4_10_14_0_8_um_filter_36_36]PJA53898.1 MAG: hypothetical protein CO166_00180 [Candidatus Roizmanbacteria bacterium CG_4_9_14_3_um_filter_36_11]PJC82222.1 MAG: hypothetical protein CO007
MKSQWFTKKQIKPNIWAIAEFEHSEEVISYLILGNNKALLFDTGLGIKNIKEVILNITSLPIVVLNSHSHFDHVGGNKLFEKILNHKIIKTLIIKPFSFQIIKTPGHTPDSICLYEKNKHWLFSGDTLYPGPIYLHLKESNLNDYKKSLLKLTKIKISKIFPAHNNFFFPKNNVKKIYNILLKKKKLDNKERIDKETSLLIKSSS